MHSSRDVLSWQFTSRGKTVGSSSPPGPHTTLNMSEAVSSPHQPYSTSTLENALRSKVSMENFYENLLVQDRDRNNRWTKLEISMEEMGLSNEEVLYNV